MKILKTLFIVVCITFGMQSCDEDVLDLKPLSSVSEIDVFNDKALLSAYVNETYTGVYHMHEANDLGTIGLEDLSYIKVQNTGGYNEYLTAQVTPDNGESFTKNRWARCFGYIRHINSYFANIEGSTIDQPSLDLLSAEMYFMRAYYYFELLKWYGPVPLVDKRYGLEDKDVRLPRASIDEVVAFIVADLDRVISSSIGTVTSPAKASKGAAMAMKGRVLLYAASELFNPSNDMSKWTAAAAANKAVMDMSEYPLASDYGAMFNTSAYLDPEVIFAKEYNLLRSQGGSSGANTLLFPNGFEGWQNAGPTQKFVDMFDMANGMQPLLPDGSVNPASGYDPQNPYANRDPRLDDIVFYNDLPFKDRTVEFWAAFTDDGNGDPTGREFLKDANGILLVGKDSYARGGEISLTGYAWRKHTVESLPNDHNKPPAVFTPDIFYRKAEAYLNYAETQIALGNEGAARDAINVIRARVNMPPINYTGDDLVEAYRRERAIELSFESHRFFDVRRWKIAEDVMGKRQKGVWVEKLSTGQFVYNYGLITAASSGYAWHDKLYWAPIPRGEIVTSEGAWTNNPGYD
ncbi:RagB/SusD family nutrient uptake outer membrane protein [Aestuariivivens marinum]|uniref:RagB/SusD family nutrient uptake outer membrane protein n=1 Tax=Aestuariivivens marinum TaxID=2913555 RepID=UPI001F57F6D7|nr:RagB/SusD family nutrient uptake outer membrane protein [Aestuariivivens marinum]